MRAYRFVPDDLLYQTSQLVATQGLRIYRRPLVLFDNLVIDPRFEYKVFRHFKPKLGETVFDLGAHIGGYTLRTAKVVGAQGKVVAVEPDIRNVSLLDQNAKANHLDNVTIVSCLISDTDGYETFSLTEDPLFSSSWPKRPVRRMVRVQALKFDTLLEKLDMDGADWIKVDIEGAEARFLRGAKAFFSRNSPRMIMETSFREVIDKLHEMDYRTKAIDENYFYCERV